MILSYLFLIIYLKYVFWKKAKGNNFYFSILISITFLFILQSPAIIENLKNQVSLEKQQELIKLNPNPHFYFIRPVRKRKLNIPLFFGDIEGKFNNLLFSES